MNEISGKTTICGIIGDPVEHSISPKMHNAAFKRLKLDYAYVPFRVAPRNLPIAIAGLRALNIRGLNVTIPHKVGVIPFLDELDPLAGKIGAVNTIVNNDGVLKGYNTDASGFLQALLAKGMDPQDKNIVVLGAGGAARAIAFILAEKGSNLIILNRLLELEWAGNLASRLTQYFQKNVLAQELNEKNLEEALGKADVVVNATSVGMTPNIEETPVHPRLLRPGLLVFDIVYNPLQTHLLLEAAQKGAGVISGIEMLLWQGVLSFELWTGAKAPVETMRTVAVEALGAYEK